MKPRNDLNKLMISFQYTLNEAGASIGKMRCHDAYQASFIGVIIPYFEELVQHSV